MLFWVLFFFLVDDFGREMFRRFFTNSITRAKIYAQTKREKSKLTKIRICVPGETEDNKLSADTGKMKFA
jgi:hypothetical protein